MSFKNTFSSVVRIFIINLLVYFARSFPVLRGQNSGTEYGPFFQGDIFGYSNTRNGIPGEGYRWSKGHFKFFVQDNYTFKEMETIYQAVLDIITNTCITVDELLTSSYFEEHIYYTPDENYCASAVGRMGWRQFVKLAPACVYWTHGIAIHETLHALGFYHEQSRPDRDDYISINLNNVLPAEKYNFDIYPSNDYGVPYDYGSIMHYDAYAFGIDPTVKVITVKQEGVEIGQRNGLSPSDIWKINLMYEKECRTKLASEVFNK